MAEVFITFAELCLKPDRITAAICGATHQMRGRSRDLVEGHDRRELLVIVA